MSVLNGGSTSWKPETVSSSPRLSRPVGVSILAVLHLIFGALQLLILALLFPKLGDREFSSAISEIGITPALLTVTLALVAILSLAAAWGLWAGNSWGWWMAGALYIYGVARLIHAAVLSQLSSHLGVSPAPQYVRGQLGALLSLFLLLYLMSGSVREYCDVLHISRWKAIGALAAAVVIFFLFAYFL
jgi:hypothetical protein